MDEKTEKTTFRDRLHNAHRFMSRTQRMKEEIAARGYPPVKLEANRDENGEPMQPKSGMGGTGGFVCFYGMPNTRGYEKEVLAGKLDRVP